MLCGCKGRRLLEHGAKAFPPRRLLMCKRFLQVPCSPPWLRCQFGNSTTNQSFPEARRKRSLYPIMVIWAQTIPALRHHELFHNVTSVVPAPLFYRGIASAGSCTRQGSLWNVLERATSQGTDFHMQTGRASELEQNPKSETHSSAER